MNNNQIEKKQQPKKRKNRKQIIRTVLFLTGILCLLLGVLLVRYNLSHSQEKQTNAVVEKPEETKGQVQETVKAATPKPTEKPKKEENIKLLAVGDDLLHMTVVRDCRKADGTYNFDKLFKGIRKKSKAADIAVINQETVLGGETIGYSGYPRFNSPTEVGDAAVKAGFNVIQHATNHSMDKGEQGMQNTLDYWKKKKGVTVIGANESKKEYNSIRILQKKGIKVALLNYTYGLNGLSLPKGREYMVDLLEEEKVRKDIAEAKSKADFVVVFPHWGIEYQQSPSAEQKKWANIFLECGVDLVIGTHPHVIQPVEWLEDNNGHRMLVYYSLGNFISSQDKVSTMLGGMAEVTITRTSDGKVGISKAGFTPLVTHFTSYYRDYSVYQLKDYTERKAREHRIRSKGLSKASLKSMAKQILGEWYKE